MDYLKFKSNIFTINNSNSFETIALEIFRFQVEHNEVYSKFVKLLGRNVNQIKSIEEIPFMPIEFFKNYTVVSSENEIEETFLSSGTTGSVQSKHHITDISVYEESYLNGFKKFYGDAEEYAVLGLLPSYLERDGSSLIYMVDDLISKSNIPQSGFYLDDFESLFKTLEELKVKKIKTILFGVSFALLDFVEKYAISFPELIIMETGGMKGRRKELVREELHKILKDGFGVEKIHSEYGMTELLSQAYSSGDGIFACPPWMKVLVRNTEDPFEILGFNKTGGLNVIDLANFNSCSFIATQDLGKKINDSEFEVVGRFDNSDIRGCNLMVL